MPEIVDVAEAVERLRAARTIAVLGASGRPWRAGHYVPQYLFERGYRILPVNPSEVGQTWWGRPVVASLAELDEPVDLIDVFRRPDTLPAHLPEILAMDPRPRVVWLQLGVRHEGVARSLAEAGIDVVQDRCTLADHQRYLAGGGR